MYIFYPIVLFHFATFPERFKMDWLVEKVNARKYKMFDDLKKVHEEEKEMQRKWEERVAAAFGDVRTQYEKEVGPVPDARSAKEAAAMMSKMI